MNFNGKALLTSESVLLFKLIKDISCFEAKFSLNSADVPLTLSEDMLHAQTVFEQSKKLMAIHKAANTIWAKHEDGGSDKQKIRLLVDSPGLLPKSLVRAAQAELAKPAVQPKQQFAKVKKGA